MARSPIHPGEILKDELDELGISAAELARQIEVPANRISQILAGRRAVVTGASDGIGLGIAARLAGAGAETVDAWCFARASRDDVDRDDIVPGRIHEERGHDEAEGDAHEHAETRARSGADEVLELRGRAGEPTGEAEDHQSTDDYDADEPERRVLRGRRSRRTRPSPRSRPARPRPRRHVPG